MKSLRLATLLLVVLVWIAASGCAPSRMYHWGDYEKTLHEQYKDPASRVEYLYTIRQIITESEKASRKVAPGLSLEYGYALYRAGYRDHALVYLAREKQTWPESAVLVDQIVVRVKTLKQAAPTEPGDPNEMYWLPGVQEPGSGSSPYRSNRKR